MADYDVAAVALASPPTSAPVQDYRPGVSVKNLGIHDADVTGTLRIYDKSTGLLVQTCQLAADTIEPGETRTAESSTLWQPTEDDIGKHFLFIATIVYPPDQYLPNNNLSPVDVVVTAEEPPPPPPVEAHAAQHENGGGDEIDVEGLTGKLAEAQTPTAHAGHHESGGEDELDVSDLSGQLADPQTPTTHAVTHQTGGSDPISGIAPSAHKTTHQNGGDDELSVAGLSGELADNQKPKAHGTSHNVDGTDTTPLLYQHASFDAASQVEIPGIETADLATVNIDYDNAPSAIALFATVMIENKAPEDALSVVLYANWPGHNVEIGRLYISAQPPSNIGFTLSASYLFSPGSMPFDLKLVALNNFSEPVYATLRSMVTVAIT